MKGPKSLVKRWLKRREESYPGFTYYTLAFYSLCFFTPALREKVLGPSWEFVDYGLLLAGTLGFAVIYRRELGIVQGKQEAVSDV